MPETEGNKNRGGNRWSRFSKTLAFWVLVILIPVMAVQLMAPRGPAMVELDYSDLIRQIANDNVDSVEFVDARNQVKGKLRSAINVQNQKVDHFWVQLPVDVNANLVPRLEEHGVHISAEPPRRNFWELAFGIIPWLV